MIKRQWHVVNVILNICSLGPCCWIASENTTLPLLVVLALGESEPSVVAVPSPPQPPHAAHALPRLLVHVPPRPSVPGD